MTSWWLEKRFIIIIFIFMGRSLLRVVVIMAYNTSGGVCTAADAVTVAADG